MDATFLNGLDPDTAALVKAAGSRRSYPARSYLWHEGDRSTGVLVVESGLLRIDRTTPTGRVVLLDLSTAGGMIGELSVIDEEVRSATTSTVTDSSVYLIGPEAFSDLMRTEPQVQEAVLRRLSRRLKALSTQFYETAMMDAPGRIAARLLRLVEIEQSLGRCVPNADGSIDLKLPISQEELGQWSGLAREGAVKGLQTLRSVNLIRTGRMRVTILDPDALAARAAQA